MTTGACWNRPRLCLANTGRYPIVTCSGVVVRDEGNVSSTRLRIASASAAVVVSAAVVGAALFGGSAISDPRTRRSGSATRCYSGHSVAVPNEVTPSRLSRSPRASAHSRLSASGTKPAVCHRELKKRATQRRSNGRPRAPATRQRPPSGGAATATQSRTTSRLLPGSRPRTQSRRP